MLDTNPGITDPYFWQLAFKNWEICLMMLIFIAGPSFYAAHSAQTSSKEKNKETKLNFLRYTNFL